MAEPLVDAVRLDVTSKATLTGLDQSLEKLRALQTALDRIHARLAGLSAGPGVKRTKAEVEELLKAGTNVKTLPVSGVAKALGVEVDKFEAHVRRWKQANKELAKTALTREGTKSGSNELAFTSASQAARVASAFYTQAEKAHKKADERMRAMFEGSPGAAAAQAQGGPASAPPPPPPIQPELPVSKTFPMTVPAAQIVATLGPGMITLMVPAGQVQAVSGAAAPSAESPSQYLERMAAKAKAEHRSLAFDSVSGVGFSRKSLNLFDETAQTVAHNWMVNTEKTLKAHPGENIHPKPLSQFTQHELAEYAGEGHQPLKEVRHWEEQVRPRAVQFAQDYLTALQGKEQAYPLTQAHFSKPKTPPAPTVRAKDLNNAQKQELFKLLHWETSDEMLPTTEWEAKSARNARGKRNSIARLKEMGLTGGEFSSLTDQGRALAQELAAEHYAATGTKPPTPKQPGLPPAPPTPPTPPLPPTPPPPPPGPFKGAVLKGQSELPKAPPPTGTGLVPLDVPVARLVAILGPGMITLNVPTSQVQGVASGASGDGGLSRAEAATRAGQREAKADAKAARDDYAQWWRDNTEADAKVHAPAPKGTKGKGGSLDREGYSGTGGGHGALIEEKTTTTAESRAVQRKELVKAGETVDNYFKEVDGALEHQKEVLTTSPVKAARAKMDAKVAGLRADLEAQLAEPGMRDPAKMATLLRKQTELMRSFVGTGEKPSDAAKELIKLGQGGLVTKARTAASKLEQRAARLEEQAVTRQQTEMAESMRRTGAIREELHAARKRGDQAEAARLKEERRLIEADIKGRNRMAAAGQKSQEAADAARRKVADQELQRQQAEAYRTGSRAGAEAQLTDFLGNGGRTKSHVVTNAGTPAERQHTVAERTLPSGEIERLTVLHDKAGSSVARLTKAQSESRKEGGYLAADFLKNTAKVTLWAASVGVLYKSLELVTTSMEKLIAVGPQVGRLEQVFKGVGGSAQDLAVDTMELAAANGAEVSQAMEASIQWSRLGLSRVEVNEAVRVSLMAANVAQVDALEATEALQGVMQAYGLSVGNLRGELGQIVQTSNSYNVTNKDMLMGLSRVAAVAHQAGLPLAELQGLLGATIGGTAQTGANIGNMMKSVILALSNPELQQKLRLNFKFEPTTGGDELKNMSRMLGDLFVKFNQLGQLQRQSLLFTVSGKTQASRLEAMLEGYVKAQYLAVSAQLHLNTAEQENEKIVAALRTQLKGLSAEWERFVFIQGNRGPVQVMVELSAALRNVFKLMNTPAGSWATTGIMGLLAAGGIRSVMAGMTMKGQDGFMGRSGAAIGGVLSNFNTSMMAVYTAATGRGLAAAAVAKPTGLLAPLTRLGNWTDVQVGQGAQKLFIWSEAMLRVGRSSAVGSAAVRGMAMAFGALTRAIGAGLIALTEWALPLTIVFGGMWAFNKMMEAMGLSSEKAQAKLAGFNEEAETAAGRANAFAQAAQALMTMQKAIAPAPEYEGMKPQEREKYLRQTAKLAGLYEPDQGKREGIQSAFEDELMTLNQQNDALGLNRRLQAEIGNYTKKRLEQLQEQAVAIAAQRRAGQAEIADLESKNRGPMAAVGFSTRAGRIVEVKKQLADLDVTAVRNIVDQTDTYEQAFAYTEKWQSELETQKVLWQNIAEVFQVVKANNPLEQADMDIAALEAQNKALDAHIALLDEADRADSEGLKLRDAQRQASREAIQAKAAEIADAERVQRQQTPEAARAAGFMGGTTTTFVSQGVADRERIEKLKGELQGIIEGAPALESQASPEMVQREHMRQEDRQTKRKNEEAEEARRRNRDSIILMRTHQQLGSQEAQRETSPFEIGRDETAKLLNKREGILQRLAALSRQPQDDAFRLSQELELQNQLYETQGALRRRNYDTERDIRQLIIDQRREMEHSLLGSGPAEMLRKMAAIRMGVGGQMGIGQFMGLSPEMRRDVALVDPRFDPKMMDLLREQRRDGRTSERQFEYDQLQVSGDKRKLQDRLSDLAGSMAPSAAAGAASMNIVAANVSVTGTTVVFKGTLVVNGVAGAYPPATGTAPKNAQAGGVGAGAGH